MKLTNALLALILFHVVFALYALWGIEVRVSQIVAAQHTDTQGK